MRKKIVYCAFQGQFSQHLLLPQGDPKIPGKCVLPATCIFSQRHKTTKSFTSTVCGDKLCLQRVR